MELDEFAPTVLEEHSKWSSVRFATKVIVLCSRSTNWMDLVVSAPLDSPAPWDYVEGEKWTEKCDLQQNEFFLISRLCGSSSLKFLTPTLDVVSESGEGTWWWVYLQQWPKLHLCSCCNFKMKRNGNHEYNSIIFSCIKHQIENGIAQTFISPMRETFKWLNEGKL